LVEKLREEHRKQQCFIGNESFTDEFTEPLDGEDSKVLSYVIQLAPYSFVAQNVFEKNNQKQVPPPCLIKYERYRV